MHADPSGDCLAVVVAQCLGTAANSLRTLCAVLSEATPHRWLRIVLGLQGRGFCLNAPHPQSHARLLRAARQMLAAATGCRLCKTAAGCAWCWQHQDAHGTCMGMFSLKRSIQQGRCHQCRTAAKYAKCWPYAGTYADCKVSLPQSAACKKACPLSQATCYQCSMSSVWVTRHACAPDGAAGLTGSSFPALGGHTLCYADGRNATRLRAHNAACRVLSMLNGCIKQELRDLPQHTSPAQSSTEGIVTDPAERGSAGSVFRCEGLGELLLERVDDLGGLAAASVAADDCHVVLTQRLQQALPDLDHRQLLPLGLPLAALSAVPPCFEAPQHLPALRLLRTV